MKKIKKYLDNDKEELCIISNSTLEPLFGDKFIHYNNSYVPRYYTTENYKLSKAYKAVVILSLSRFAEKIYDNVYLFSEEDFQYQIDYLNIYLNTLVKELINNFDDILFYSFEIDPYEDLPYSYKGWNYIVSNCNKLLFDLDNKYGSIVIEDINKLCMLIGYNNFVGKALKYTYEIIYSVIAIDKFAESTALWINKEKNKKCLILDCDGVLWGGIYAEVGLNNIILGRTGIGSIYREFQRQLVKLFSTGVILCLCSKNIEKDIWSVFENHPDMLLKREHICTYRIDYSNKAKNIESIIDELNIGADSIIYIDDNNIEVNLINIAFPELKTIYFNSVEEIKNFCKLTDFKLWKNYGKTLNRTQLYREMKERKKVYDSLESQDVKKILNMQISVYLAKEIDIIRIVELSNRCNQFNLSARKYNYTEINDRLLSESYDLFCLKAEDDFGTYGMVGCSIVYYTESIAYIEAFYLSCRVFGLDFEDILLDKILKIIVDRGINEVKAVFVKNAKNSVAETYFKKKKMILTDKI